MRPATRLPSARRLPGALFPLATFLLIGACASPETACDRRCLLDVADGYLSALATGAPGATALADDADFHENNEPLTTSEGLWSAASGVRNYRIVVPDEVQRSVGLITIVDRRDAGPALLAAHLTLEGQTIAAIEHLVADVTEEADMALLRSPRPALTSVLPEDERMSRAELIEIASSYYDALDRSDGSLAPFADDCERQENGMITASFRFGPASFDSVDVNGRSPPPVARDCIGQMDSRRFAYIDSIDNRRIVAVDPVQGLAMGFSHFRQSMDRGPHRMIAADGTAVMWEERREPYDLPAAHIFGIRDGEIHEVEAIGVFLPYDSPIVPSRR